MTSATFVRLKTNITGTLPSSKQDMQNVQMCQVFHISSATASRTYRVRRRVSVQMKRCCYSTAKTGCFIFLVWPILCRRVHAVALRSKLNSLVSSPLDSSF